MNGIATDFDRKVIDDLMKQIGTRRNSRSPEDYEKAKLAIAKMGFRPGQYQRAISVISKYIGV